MKSNQKGIAFVPIIIAVVVGLLATGGYNWYTTNKAPATEENPPITETGGEGTTHVPPAEEEPNLQTPDAQIYTAPDDVGEAQIGKQIVLYGNLLNATDTAGKWIILYDDPEIGSPAASMILHFQDYSMCDFGSGKQVCDEDNFVHGTRIKVEGMERDDQIWVKLITAV